ncbi:probable bifunctional dTTP/UTP pyrophosphatase/methyltransferase protein isoform X3 [Ostrea edulis]|uniref:probable bifunctional dTTP/UTP pyrophosphatase/methyltransferase protein isoform X3 n=1 Tax=Ostrea edulis TaxID=37623 RepID=UPI00209409D3|nr:probable bifunctional dTTP/UTP pyrophosphatase/methyltransferase protein isoform X3 [Ostrea edulis]
MLEPILQQLNSKRIVLASSSPRRRQILGNIPSPDLIIGADTIVTNGKSIFEKPSSKDHAIEMITRLNKMACCDLDYFYLLLGYAAKNSFCGRSHKVLTSVVLVTPKSSDMFKGRISLNARLDITQFEEESEVSMPNLTEDIIKSYVNTGESMDKAGGYGIQAVGGSLVSGIHGDYFNVMGFPLHRFCVELRNICILR